MPVIRHQLETSPVEGGTLTNDATSSHAVCLSENRFVWASIQTSPDKVILHVYDSSGYDNSTPTLLTSTSILDVATRHIHILRISDNRFVTFSNHPSTSIKQIRVYDLLEDDSISLVSSGEISIAGINTWIYGTTTQFLGCPFALEAIDETSFALNTRVSSSLSSTLYIFKIVPESQTLVQTSRTLSWAGSGVTGGTYDVTCKYIPDTSCLLTGYVNTSGSISSKTHMLWPMFFTERADGSNTYIISNPNFYSQSTSFEIPFNDYVCHDKENIYLIGSKSDAMLRWGGYSDSPGQVVKGTDGLNQIYSFSGEMTPSYLSVKGMNLDEDHFLVYDIYSLKNSNTSEAYLKIVRKHGTTFVEANLESASNNGIHIPKQSFTMFMASKGLELPNSNALVCFGSGTSPANTLEMMIIKP